MPRKQTLQDRLKKRLLQRRKERLRPPKKPFRRFDLQDAIIIGVKYEKLNKEKPNDLLA